MMDAKTGFLDMTTSVGEPDRGLSRRQFLGGVMLATSSVALIGGSTSSCHQIGAYTRAWGRRLIARLRRGGFTSGPLMVECLNVGDLDYVNGEARKTRELVETIIA